MKKQSRKTSAAQGTKQKTKSSAKSGKSLASKAKSSAKATRKKTPSSKAHKSSKNQLSIGQKASSPVHTTGKKAGSPADKNLAVPESSKEESKPMAEASWPSDVIIYTDGASRGNPGPASIGVYIISEEGHVLSRHGEKIGSQTNNYAEYLALKRGLELARRHGASSVTVRADSELMIRQLSGIYKVKSESIRQLFEDCRALLREFKSVELEHVRREFNKEADALANMALDGIL